MALDRHLGAGESARPFVLRAVHRERIRCPRVVLVDRVEQPFLVLGRLPEPDLHPAVIHLQGPRAHAERPIVDRPHRRHRLFPGTQRHAPGGLGPGCPPHTIEGDVELQMVRGRREPEPAVDRRLRGEQRRDDLAPLQGLGAHAGHQLAKDASASMGRQHADEGDAARGDEPAARHDHPLREHAGAADDPTVVEGGEGAIGLQHHPVGAHLVRIGVGLGERRGERPEERVDLLLGDRAVVHGEPA